MDSTGQILNDNGDFVGQLAEGDLQAVKGRPLNEKGEILDDGGNVLGRAQLHPDVMALVDQAKDVVSKAKEAAGGSVDTGEEDIILLGKVEQAKETAEGLAGDSADELPLDLHILEGLRANKKGIVLDEEGEQIGRLVEGDPKNCAGKVINEKGEILDSAKKVVGKVEVVSSEASEEALRKLQGQVSQVPGLEILEGLKVNKKGTILDEEGEVIGELVDGEVADCAGKKCNDKGEVLDKNGQLVGHVKTLLQTGEESAGEAVEGLQEKAKEVGGGRW